MKILTIIRHAKSTWDFPELSDRERPLNDRGLRDAPIMGSRLAAAGFPVPDLIICSPAVRTRETARILAEKLAILKSTISFEERLYHASVGDLLTVIAEQDAAIDHLLIVGHNPGLTEFVNFLSPALTSNLPTSGIIAFSINQPDWKLVSNHLGRAPETTLLLFDYPKKQS